MMYAAPCSQQHGAAFCYAARARVLSSVGRASPLHGECRGFESLSTHHSDVSPTSESVWHRVEINILRESERSPELLGPCESLPSGA